MEKTLTLDSFLPISTTFDLGIASPMVESPSKGVYSRRHTGFSAPHPNISTLSEPTVTATLNGSAHTHRRRSSRPRNGVSSSYAICRSYASPLRQRGSDNSLLAVIVLDVGVVTLRCLLNEFSCRGCMLP